MTQYLNHVVRQGESLESIADATVGDADRWREIALLNRLRWPFISDDPSYQYGQVITSGATTADIATNATTYTVTPPLDGSVYSAGTVFYVDRVELTSLKYDALSVLSVQTTTGVLTFKPGISLTLLEAVAPGLVTVLTTNIDNVRIGSFIRFDSETVTVTALSGADADASFTAVFTASHTVGTTGTYGFQNSYQVGTLFRLFPPRSDDTTRVLRTGDVVRIPRSVGDSLTASTGDALFLDLLGVDVHMGLDGLIQFGADGDVRRVSGTANLAQALRGRLNTPIGSYNRYPLFGNRVWDYLGSTTEPQFLSRVQGLVREALLTDPRVGAVRDINVSSVGSSLGIDAQVEVLQTSTAIRPDNLVINVGG